MSRREPRTIATWQAPSAGGKTSAELLFALDRGREKRVLILPALFDEANKLRRLTIQMMRAADELGIDTFLPDLPGCNESLQALQEQTIDAWRKAAKDAAEAFSATHVLTIRGGALIAPEELPGWQYAPISGAKLLRGMIRARTIAAREAGREETADQLLAEGRASGLALAGWHIGSAMLRELESAEPAQIAAQSVIAQKDLGGAGLWLRAEPEEDDAISEALARIMLDPDEGRLM